MYFSALIFSRIGFTSPILTSLSIAISNFLFTLAALLAIDRIGRRQIVLWSVPVMVFALRRCSLNSLIFLDVSLPCIHKGRKTFPRMVRTV